MTTSQNLVLRTVYISPELDDLLRVQAFTNRTSKGDLIRKYLVEGIRAVAQAGTPVSKMGKATVTLKNKVRASAAPRVKAAGAMAAKSASKKAAAKKAMPKKAAAKKAAPKKASA